MTHCDRLSTELTEARVAHAETLVKLESLQISAGQRTDAWLAACAKLEAVRDVVSRARASGCVPSLVCAQFDQLLDPQLELTPCTPAERKVLDACGALDEGLLLIIAQRYTELIPLLEAVTAAREKPDGG